MKWHLCAAIAALLFLQFTPAFAFGTISKLGQNAEHERITRHALACTYANDCLQPKSLTELAGGKGDFGAIGIPDRGSLVFVPKAHCDRGDYLDVPNYPQTKAQAQAALEACRNWMREKFDEAIKDSKDLLDAQGHLRKSQIAVPCFFVGEMKGHAKCNVIEDLGIMLHAAQDFYSHSNWVDRPDSARAIGADNPPGLGNSGRAPWLDLRNDTPFPDGLITGCFENEPEKSHCNYGQDGTVHRVKHAVVNKDTGTIDPEIGAGTTVRGALNGNFARAVNAAIDDTRDKWAMFREKLVEVYGTQPAALMACAIAHDDSVKDCL